MQFRVYTCIKWLKFSQNQGFLAIISTIILLKYFKPKSAIILQRSFFRSFCFEKKLAPKSAQRSFYWTIILLAEDCMLLSSHKSYSRENITWTPKPTIMVTHTQCHIKREISIPTSIALKR